MKKEGVCSRIFEETQISVSPEKVLSEEALTALFWENTVYKTIYIIHGISECMHARDPNVSRRGRGILNFMINTKSKYCLEEAQICELFGLYIYKYIN